MKYANTNTQQIKERKQNCADAQKNKTKSDNYSLFRNSGILTSAV